jgi:hypothetical protein
MCVCVFTINSEWQQDKSVDTEEEEEEEEVHVMKLLTV